VRSHHIPACLCLTAAALSLGACASAQSALRSQPSTHFAVEDFNPGGDLKNLVVVRCAKISDAKYEASTAKSAPKTSCRYVSADVTRLAGLGTKNDSPLPAAVLDLLLWISDYNCSNFLSRAYGVRSTFDLARKFIGDLASAASAGAASAAPGVSAGLDVVNLVVGKANSNFDSQFYANATFDAMEEERLHRPDRELVMLPRPRRYPGSGCVWYALLPQPRSPERRRDHGPRYSGRLGDRPALPIARRAASTPGAGLGRVKEADLQFQSALAVLAAKLPPGNPDLAAVRADYAKLVRAPDQPPTARQRH
jgi:hypothetical protein